MATLRESYSQRIDGITYSKVADLLTDTASELGYDRVWTAHRCRYLARTVGKHYDIQELEVIVKALGFTRAEIVSAMGWEKIFDACAPEGQ